MSFFIRTFALNLIINIMTMNFIELYLSTLADPNMAILAINYLTQKLWMDLQFIVLWLSLR